MGIALNRKFDTLIWSALHEAAERYVDGYEVIADFVGDGTVNHWKYNATRAKTDANLVWVFDTSVAATRAAQGTGTGNGVWERVFDEEVAHKNYVTNPRYGWDDTPGADNLAAFTACAADNDYQVVIPENTTVNLSARYLHPNGTKLVVRGLSRDTSIVRIIDGVDSFQVFSTTGNATNQREIDISNLTIDGNKAATNPSASSNGKGISIASGPARISNVTIKDTHNESIRGNGSAALTAVIKLDNVSANEEIRITSYSDVIGTDLDVSGSSNNGFTFGDEAEFCRYKLTRLNGSGNANHGIAFINGARDTSLIDCIANDNIAGSGIVFGASGSNMDRYDGIYVANPTCLRNGDSGFTIDLAQTGTVLSYDCNTVIHGGHFDENSVHGMVVAAARGVRAIEPKCDNNGNRAVAISSSQNIVFEGGEYDDSDNVGNTASSIQVFTTDKVCDQIHVYRPKMKYGLAVSATTATNTSLPTNVRLELHPEDKYAATQPTLASGHCVGAEHFDGTTWTTWNGTAWI